MLSAGRFTPKANQLNQPSHANRRKAHDPPADPHQVYMKIGKLKMTFSGRTYLAASRTRALCFQPMLLKTRYKARQSRASGDRSHGAFIWSDRRKFARQSLIKRTAFDIFTRNWCLQNSPGYLFFDALGRVMSSYQLDRMNTNPLGDFTVKVVYF